MRRAKQLEESVKGDGVGWTSVRRWLLKAGLTAIALGAALLIVAGVYLLTLPGVGDAEHRVDMILALHHGTRSASRLPTKLGDAVVATEDEHFYSNVVVNFLDGAGRAALATLQTSKDPGGSTIAQQLAKQLYGHGSGLAETLREIGLGVKLSLHYSKPQILDMYLNVVYYGHGYWGDVAAARGYFGKSPYALDWAQATLLAGLPQAPSAYDPDVHLTLAKERQRHVLDRLVVNHYLTPAEANVAYAQPLGLR
jgi:membrane peptidoglycan carboxypeptidase